MNNNLFDIKYKEITELLLTYCVEVFKVLTTNANKKNKINLLAFLHYLKTTALLMHLIKMKQNKRKEKKNYE